MDLSTHGVVAVIRNQEGKFLLLEEARELLNGAYAPPHGRCEVADLTEENSVIREAKEETNLNVRPIKKLLTQNADTKIKTVTFWLTDLIDGDIRMSSEEVLSYGWFDVDEALNLTLYPGTKIFFEKIKSKEIILSS